MGQAEPSHELTVIGGLSASANSYFGGDVQIAGTLIGGSPLKIAGAIEIYDVANGGGVVASLGDVSEDGTTKMSASAGQFSNLTASTHVSSSFYYGDGRYLTNVTASAIMAGDGPIGSLQFRVDNPISNEISGTTKVSYSINDNSLTINGGLVHSRVSVSSSHTASSENYIIGVSAVPTNIFI